MKEFFATYPLAAWSVVSVLLAAVTIVLLWQRVRWWWLNTWYSFPVIGKVASLSRDVNRSQEAGWFKAERTLCRDYKKFIRIQDEHDFNEKIAYLTKAGDLGRRETPTWIWVLTIAMVFVEAMGFSYVLAGYTLPGASENLQQTGAYGIAFLISVILVAFTHFAGHELFVSSQIQNARREWEDAGRKHDLTTGMVALAKPQNVDDAQPGYSQLANRVGTLSSRKIAMVTVVFVAVVAIFATYVRGQVLEKQLHQEVVGQTPAATLSVPQNGDGLNLSVTDGGVKSVPLLPDADVAQAKKAEDKAREDQVAIDRHGGWGTFIVLAFVFVFLQILGVIFGYRWGFAGRESAAAHRAVGHGRYATYADVREHYKEIADAAQSKLEQLQQRLMYRNSKTGTTGIHTSKTFRDFMEDERQNETRERANERQHQAQRVQIEQVAARSSVHVAEPSDPVAPPTAQQIEVVLNHLAALTDKADKKAYLDGLPTGLFEQAAEALKVQKEEKARRDAKEKRQRSADIDSLLD